MFNNIKMFSYYIEDGLGWFRIFGKGLHFKNTHKHRLIFSERIGKQKRLVIGKWSIRILK